MLKKFFLLAMVLISSCTTQPKEEAIPQYFMPFILPIATANSNVFIGATNNDERYKSGKLATSNIKKMLSADSNPKNYISKENEIYSDTQIIKIFESKIFLISKVNNNLLILPLNKDNIDCQTNTQTLYNCKNSISHRLKNDPKNLELIKYNGTTYAFVNYASEYIDILKIEPTKISFVKSISVASVSPKNNANYEVIKVQHNKDSIFILFKSYIKKHKKDYDENKENIHDTSKEYQSNITKIAISDIINNDYNKLETKNLSDLGIIDTKDLYVDDNKAWILNYNPSTIIQINLANFSVIKKVDICSSATMLATDSVKNVLVIPCFKDNIVQLYSLNELEVKNQANIKKQTPSYAAIDNVNNIILVSYFEEHMVGVFDMNLKLIKTLFSKAK